jgi:hypothetical protein
MLEPQLSKPKRLLGNIPEINRITANRHKSARVALDDKMGNSVDACRNISTTTLK